eukprot:1186745-Prorocentrum_minimum.AAC.4
MPPDSRLQVEHDDRHDSAVSQGSIVPIGDVRPAVRVPVRVTTRLGVLQMLHPDPCMAISVCCT